MITSKRILNELINFNENSKEVYIINKEHENKKNYYIAFNDRTLRDSMTSKVASVLDKISGNTGDITWQPLYDPSTDKTSRYEKFVYNIVVTTPPDKSNSCYTELKKLFIANGYLIK